MSMSQKGVNRRCRVRGLHPTPVGECGQCGTGGDMVNKRGKCLGVGDIGAAFGCGGSAGGAPPSGGACPGGSVAFHGGAAVAAWSILGHGTTTSLPQTTGRVQHRVFPIEEADICPPSIYFPCFPRSAVRNHRSGTHFLSYKPLFMTRSCLSYLLVFRQRGCHPRTFILRKNIEPPLVAFLI